MQSGEAVPIKDIAELKDLSDSLSEKARNSTMLTPAEVDLIKNVLKSQIYLGDHASLPMICCGPKCPIAEGCPLRQIDKAPIGNRCPIEMTLMGTWKAQYENALQADWNDKVERQAVMDLVEADILSARANGIIAVEGFIMENAIGISETTGMPVYRKEKHVALEVKDMIHRRKERLLKSLILTREMKRKLGMGGGDPAKRESELLERVRKSREREANHNASTKK
jgi:hypothetical protein